MSYETKVFAIELATHEEPRHYDWHQFWAQDAHEAVSIAREKFPKCDIQQVFVAVSNWDTGDQDGDI